MNDWKIALLHTRRETLLKRVFEAAFPGRVVSIHVPSLREAYHSDKGYLVDYFRRWVYDSGIWDGRVLTVYGSGSYHHFTYALIKLALERRGLDGFNWTYFHWDHHRDDWGERDRNGQPELLHCANFVDSIAHDHQGIPFMVGPDAYPNKDKRGYVVHGNNIPIYHNFFTKKLQRSQLWPSNAPLSYNTGLELPSVDDLRATPTETYLTFDLDLLTQSEMVTDYDQNPWMTVRRICRMLDHVRPFKRIFSADILGLPEERHHPLSALTMVILARKIMGLGARRLLEYHTLAKRRQAALLNPFSAFQMHMGWTRRESPIEEGELLEVLRWTQT